MHRSGGDVETRHGRRSRARLCAGDLTDVIDRGLGVLPKENGEMLQLYARATSRRPMLSG